MEKYKDIKQSEDTRPYPPSSECLECKLFQSFVTCFGLTRADMQRI